jgi:ATP-dependent DNA helicase RecQ
MRSMPRKSLQNLVYQLVDQGLLERTSGDRPILKLSDDAVGVLRGHKEVRLIEPKSAKVKRAAAEELSWESVDRGLFESLRQLRRAVAAERNVAPFVIFSDSTLREMAAVRPASEQSFITIRGIGQRKAADYGRRFVAHIAEYCDRHRLGLDAQAGSRPRSLAPAASGARGEGQLRRGPSKPRASEMFDRGATIADVAAQFGVSLGTATKYLCEHIEHRKPGDLSRWIDSETYRRIAEASKSSEDGRLKPIFERLGRAVPYDTIRLVITHLQAMASIPSL